MNNNIIEKANELIKGKGDGRISKDDITQILTLVKYENIENIKSLLNIYKNYNLTDPAKEEIYNFIFVGINYTEY